MQATSKDLRFHTKEILDAAMRGEEVIITFHGKPYVSDRAESPLMVSSFFSVARATLALNSGNIFPLVALG